MHNPVYHDNEQKVIRAFDGQSVTFDKLYAENSIVRYKRKRVRERLMKILRPGSHILELNSGTGEDAIWLANKNFKVHATDISSGMQKRMAEKISKLGLNDSITYERCSFTSLDLLGQKGPFDCIFSNFAGLNCTGDLDKVLYSFDPLLKPGGVVVLVILSKFCLWESLLIFKGKFKTAFRRLFSSSGSRANIQGVQFNCWYYSPSYVQRHMSDQYKMISLEGLCTIVPPSYIEGFAEKYPNLFRRLRKWERRLKNHWPWNRIGDYYIISFKKRS